MCLESNQWLLNASEVFQPASSIEMIFFLVSQEHFGMTIDYIMFFFKFLSVLQLSNYAVLFMVILVALWLADALSTNGHSFTISHLFIIILKLWHDFTITLYNPFNHCFTKYSMCYYFTLIYKYSVIRGDWQFMVYSHSVRSKWKKGIPLASFIHIAAKEDLLFKNKYIFVYDMKTV